MSRFVPILFRDMMRPLRQMENEMRMLEQEFFRPTSFMNRPKYFLKYPEAEQASVAQLKDKFQVKLDVDGFKPEELKVKTITDQNAIEIEGKHEEREDDHGLISRHFVRRFVLPKGHDLKNVVSSLTDDGVLTVTAPKKPQEIAQEKTIPVEHITDGKEGQEKK
ncbi:alpha-crystallin B chain-like [Anthonomus grandis grandis]|uniref:alpha-crystallin B chain-like n=1 Tax=Anthonomus grandis grandis TaxID=2921223 RepID=UPI0021660321|nr:alpha-crystallin B chain-like [Anthonomus grandis grandis]